MAMSGDTLGNAIGVAFYNAIPSTVKECMSETAKAETCTALIDNAKIIANCVVAHITSNAVVTVAAGIAVTAGSCSGSTVATGTGTIA